MSAVFSPCRTWRYTLTRDIEGGRGVVAFVGLNPSTADEETDDPTVRRCVGFARDWGFGRLVMLNVFAYRATDPAKLCDVDAVTAVGPGNDEYLCREALRADLVVAAWGVYGAWWGRGSSVRAMLAALGVVDLRVLGLTKGGEPRHPLYMRRDLRPQPWV